MTDPIRTAETRVAPESPLRLMAGLVGRFFGRRRLAEHRWERRLRPDNSTEYRVTLVWEYHPLVEEWGMPPWYPAASPLAAARLNRWRAAHRRVRAGKGV